MAYDSRRSALEILRAGIEMFRDNKIHAEELEAELEKEIQTQQPTKEITGNDD